MSPQPPAQDRPARRQWVVPIYPTNPETGETIKDDAYRDDREFAQAILELKGILDRLGGTVAISTRREEFTGPNDIRTTGLIFRWEAYVPVQRAPEAEAPAEPAAPAEQPVEEPVAS